MCVCVFVCVFVQTCPVSSPRISYQLGVTVGDEGRRNFEGEGRFALVEGRDPVTRPLLGSEVGEGPRGSWDAV